MTQSLIIQSHFTHLLTKEILQHWAEQQKKPVAKYQIGGDTFWMKKATPSEKTTWHRLGNLFRPLFGRLLSSNVDLDGITRLMKERNVLISLTQKELPVVEIAA